MKVRICVMVAFTIFITGCGISDNMIQTALAETSEKIPTDTPAHTSTQIPTNSPSPTFTITSTSTPAPSKTPTATNTKIPTDTPSDTPTIIPTPTGPADITAFIPPSVPYERAGSKCKWKLAIDFQSENGVDATINQIGNIFVSPGGWKYYVGGEHKNDVDIFIHGYQSFQYVTTLTSGLCDSFVGGVLTFTYYGYDVNGNQIYGNIFTKFAKP